MRNIEQQSQTIQHSQKLPRKDNDHRQQKTRHNQSREIHKQGRPANQRKTSKQAKQENNHHIE